ncbi:MAG TPA: ATP-binding protein [Thermoanaerobaculales bacterium]|nr:ATP-binding protein [Thermoanaerobaculales bacterium]HPA81657.1 ATP-binding protein [Thermoanaerobaculales bacterium]HQN96524.1 ATP-binding protein [Thermoanaerobaculales bacterium]HQP44675.1 ATP-binding protein [Thermoanaerobaculales bacterium]
MSSLTTRLIGERGSLQRQYSLATALFAVLVLAIILLYGHFIAQSLSRSYLEDVLITGREEAERIAEELGGESAAEFFDVVERRREVLRKTLEGLPQREVFETVEVRDKNGELRYVSRFQATADLSHGPVGEIELGSDLSDQQVTETENTYQLAVPLGEVGEVVVSVSKARVAERINRLRSELLSRTFTAAAITLTTLVIAFVLVWHLIQRTRRLEETAREAEDMAALGTLAANLAHEIRNPLNSINLNLELLEEDVSGQDPEVTGSLTTTRREVDRLARLVSDFLAYARPSEAVLTEVRVRALLEDVLGFLRAEATSLGVHLRIVPEIPDAALLTDDGQLRQVLLNLVLNAIQAVAGLEPDRRVVELAAAEEDGSVTLVVRDRGPGIPADELPRVRAAFYTRRRGGTGLGLAIADRFVSSLGGHIDLVNLEGHGFEARIFLPLDPRDGKMSG